MEDDLKILKVYTVSKILKVYTVSKDGTWKVFDTAIEFTKGQV